MNSLRKKSRVDFVKSNSDIELEMSMEILI